jgi:hypothetical protein
MNAIMQWVAVAAMLTFMVVTIASLPQCST